VERTDEALEIFEDRDLENEIMKLLVPYFEENLCTSTESVRF